MLLFCVFLWNFIGWFTFWYICTRVEHTDVKVKDIGWICGSGLLGPIMAIMVFFMTKGDFILFKAKKRL